MTPDRFEQLVETYGSEPARWPAHERATAERLLAESDSARSVLQAQQALDRVLDLYQVPAMPQMERRILSAAREISRESPLDRMLDWLLPRSGALTSWAWRPALAATLPLICGILLANYYSFGIDPSQNSLQEELYLISMNDYAEITE